VSEQSLFVSSSLKFGGPPSSDFATFIILLDAITAAVAPLRLTHSYTLTTSGSVGRGTPLPDTKQIHSKLYRRTTETLALLSQHPDKPVQRDAYASVDLERSAASNVEKNVNRPLERVSFNRTLPSSETRQYITALQRVFSLLNAPSGYVHATSEWTCAVSETGFVGVSPTRPEPPSRPDGTRDPDVARAWLMWKHEEDTNERVRAVADVRAQVGPRLRGTYWGTFLGREMVDELGGAVRVRREAPVHLVESFGDGALYLQLTPEPAPITTPAMQTGLLALEQFLLPVLVPLPPYWATRAAKAAQRAAERGGTTTSA